MKHIYIYMNFRTFIIRVIYLIIQLHFFFYVLRRREEGEKEKDDEIQQNKYIHNDAAAFSEKKTS